MNMRYALTLLVLAGCGSNHFNYPVTVAGNLGDDGGQAGAAGDVGLLPFGRGTAEDGGTLDADAGQLADASQAVAHDGGVAVSADAGATSRDAGAAHDAAVLSLGGVCDQCKTDVDCAAGFSCLYRGPDGYKSCQYHWSAGVATPKACIGGASVTGLQVITNDGGRTFWGTPYPDSRTCASWLGQWGP
jgi:hypothetical protein